MAPTPAVFSKLELDAYLKKVMASSNLLEKLVKKLLNDMEDFVLRRDVINFVPVLGVKLSVFDEKFKKLKAAHDEAMLKCSEDDISEDSIDHLMDKLLNTQINLDARIAPLREIIRTARLDEERATPASPFFSKTVPGVNLPSLNLPKFSDNSRNLSDFLAFSSQFKNTIATQPDLSPEMKFIYLKNCLTGRALSLVENLNVDSESYNSAFEILNHTFLNKELIIDKSFAELLSYPSCSTTTEVEHFLDLVLRKEHELGKLGVEFVSNHSSLLLFSHIVRSKLPKYFLQEVIRIVKENYPTSQQILKNFHKIIEMLNIKTHTNENRRGEAGGARPEAGGARPKAGVALGRVSSAQPCQPRVAKAGESVKEVSRLQPKGCAFCSLLNHSSTHCKRFSNYQNRIKKAAELGKCIQCLSSAHTKDYCPGNASKLHFPCKSCGQSSHVTPLCPMTQLSFSASKYSSKNEGSR